MVKQKTKVIAAKRQKVSGVISLSSEKKEIYNNNTIDNNTNLDQTKNRYLL